MRYYDVVIDNKTDKTDRPYTYAYDRQLKAGDKVIVPFALGNKPREAYVTGEAKEPEEAIRPKIKEISEVDEEVRLSREMMATAAWMKSRYLCRYIDAIRLFTPAGSKAKRRKPKPLIEPKTIEEEVPLTREQQEAMEQIEAAVDKGEHDRFLIHGVTGSGKTELYIRAARSVISKGRTVIVLVPEISLTGQVVDRFRARFGAERLAILHSRLTQGERYDEWQRIRNGQVDIVIGARSAVFAPREHIGLIVSDEEHESTYKSDFTPKYDTVEVALKRTSDKDNNGVLLLGSATPSVVTYNRAKKGIYKLITLTERYNKNPLPDVEVVDMREELRSGNRSVISSKLRDGIIRNVEEGRQVMLFLNRRGYSTFLSCRECGFVLKCPVCGLSLTYHKKGDVAVCHFCGHSEAAPEHCPDCGSPYMRYFGTGTEKLQEAVQELFPEYVTDRLDLDTIKERGALAKRLRAFRKKETDILIGTQIIAKGLDFRNVGLVGIVAADVSLNIPDFRSPERTFQLVTQAAGRAGRGDRRGEVIIQTYSPDNYAVKFSAAQDYEGFYREEDMIRHMLCYPPYSDLFRVVFTAEDPQEAAKGAGFWYEQMNKLLPEEERRNIFKPQEAYMSKIREVYRWSMLIKCPAGKRKIYSAAIEEIRSLDRAKKKKAYTAVVDINPYSFS